MAIRGEPFSLDKFGESYTETKEEKQKNRFNKFYSKHKKLVLFGAGILCVVFLVFYFLIFFQQGRKMYDDFFTYSTNDGRAVYTSNTSYGKAEIVSSQVGQNSFKVTYNMPENEPIVYTAEFSQEKGDSGRENLIISSDSKVIFEGEYDSNSSMFLYDKNGDIIMGDDIITVTAHYSNSAENPYKDFLPTMRGIASIAKGEGVRTRGNWLPLILAFFIFGVTAFDIKYPRALFTLEHFMSVNNPEPSDFYIMMQHASWVFMPIIGFILMIVGLFVD